MTENSFSCESCGKSFGTAMALMGHSRIHKEKDTPEMDVKEERKRKKRSANTDFFIEDDSQSLNPLYAQPVRDRNDKKVYYHIDGNPLELKYASIEGSYLAEDPKTGLIVYFPPGTVSAAKITMKLNEESDEPKDENEPENEKTDRVTVEDDKKSESGEKKQNKKPIEGQDYVRVGLFRIRKDSSKTDILSKEDQRILESEPVEEHHGSGIGLPLFLALTQFKSLDDKRELVIKARNTAMKHPDWSDEKIINTFWNPDDRKILRELSGKGIKLRVD